MDPRIAQQLFLCCCSMVSTPLRGLHHIPPVSVDVGTCLPCWGPEHPWHLAWNVAPSRSSANVSQMNECTEGSGERWHRLGFYHYKNDLLPIFVSAWPFPQGSEGAFSAGWTPLSICRRPAKLGDGVLSSQKHTGRKQSLDSGYGPLTAEAGLHKSSAGPKVSRLRAEA